MSLLFINRMKKEQAQMRKNLPAEIKCFPCGDSIDKYEGQIMGPPGSPYENGTFIININIPENYPFGPPIMRFKTPIYHPNIDEAGRICMNLLKTTGEGNWNPSENIQSLLMAIMVLMADPNPSDPLLPDIADEYASDRKTFIDKATAHTKKYAINSYTIEFTDEKLDSLDQGDSELDKINELGNSNLMKPRSKKLSLSTKNQKTKAALATNSSKNQSAINDFGGYKKFQEPSELLPNSAESNTESSTPGSIKKIKTLGLRRPVSSTPTGKSLPSLPNPSKISFLTKSSGEKATEISNTNDSSGISGAFMDLPAITSKPISSRTDSEISVAISLSQKSDALEEEPDTLNLSQLNTDHEETLIMASEMGDKDITKSNVLDIDIGSIINKNLLDSSSSPNGLSLPKEKATREPKRLKPNGPKPKRTKSKNSKNKASKESAHHIDSKNSSTGPVTIADAKPDDNTREPLAGSATFEKSSKINHEIRASKAQPDTTLSSDGLKNVHFLDFEKANSKALPQDTESTSIENIKKEKTKLKAEKVLENPKEPTKYHGFLALKAPLTELSAAEDTQTNTSPQKKMKSIRYKNSEFYSQNAGRKQFGNDVNNFSSRDLGIDLPPIKKSSKLSLLKKKSPKLSK